jgi:hypothetical protein
LKRLAEWQLVSIPAELLDNSGALANTDLRLLFRDVKNNVIGKGPIIETIYIQPVEDSSHRSIGFEEFADSIEGCSELGALFGSYLRKWIVPV